MQKNIIILFISLFLASGSFAQSSRWSYELGSNVSYHANNGVWGLKINNGFEYQLNNRFSAMGTIGYSQSLIDWQNNVVNGFSLLTADLDLNYKLFSTSKGSSLNIAAGLSWFDGHEYNNVGQGNWETHYLLKDPGFNLKLRYKHIINDKLTGSINLEAYSYQHFFPKESDLVLVNIGYSLYYRF